jgi:hypothetical protein
MYEALQKQVDIEDIIDIKAREKVGRSKYVKEDDLGTFDAIEQELKQEISALTE